MFRCKQKLKSFGSGKIWNLEEHINEAGEYTCEYIDQGEKKLPDPELFDLKAQLKAGVDLEETNSKVFKSKSVNADTVVRKYTKKEKVTNVETSDN